jgi:hypothetical protein
MYRYHGAPVLNAHLMQYRKHPFIVGEFGALRSDSAYDIRRSAYAMRDLQREMCGLDAKGYLFWTWDTDERLASQELFFRGNEERGAINGQLLRLSFGPIRAGSASVNTPCGSTAWRVQPEVAWPLAV